MSTADRMIKNLSEFGEGFKHHHENYEAYSISQIRETGGVWDFGDLVFHFPEHFGFCYGVDKAIDMVFETCERFGHRRIFLTDQLIHNPYINGKLKDKGVHYLQRDSRNLLICGELQAGDVVVVSAFGTDFRDIQHLKDKQVTIVDSTCGAIINVWKRVEGYAKKGFVTVMHGKRNHEETRATVSQAVREGGAYIIIENKKEADDLARVIEGQMKEREFIEKYPGAVSLDFLWDSANCRMGMANQTTMLKGESLEIQEILKAAVAMRFGLAATLERFKSFDTICGATQDRQDALRNLLRKPLDLALIVGGFNSSNTRHLAEIAEGRASVFNLADALGSPRPLARRLPIYHIESAEDILSKDLIRARDPGTGDVKEERSWFPQPTHQIGITSGASTPDIILQRVIEKIRSLKTHD